MKSSPPCGLVSDVKQMKKAGEAANVSRRESIAKTSSLRRALLKVAIDGTFSTWLRKSSDSISETPGPKTKAMLLTSTSGKVSALRTNLPTKRACKRLENLYCQPPVRLVSMCRWLTNGSFFLIDSVTHWVHVNATVRSPPMIDY